ANEFAPTGMPWCGGEFIRLPVTSRRPGAPSPLAGEGRGEGVGSLRSGYVACQANEFAPTGMPWCGGEFIRLPVTSRRPGAPSPLAGEGRGEGAREARGRAMWLVRRMNSPLQGCLGVGANLFAYL